jgi:hypothetical protein
MAKLCVMPLVGTVSGSAVVNVSVNPLLVRYLREAPQHTIIYFDKESSLNVAKPLDWVQAEINAALG